MRHWTVAWASVGLLMAVGLPALAQEANLPAEVRAEIVKMGPTLNPTVISKSSELMRPLQAPRSGLPVSKDIAYGSDPLQKLDLYPPQRKSGGPSPIVVFVHGGGFARGDKRGGENVAAYFARHGMLGVTMNYRLTPAATWPAQSLDIGSATAWLRANAGRYGGDPNRIILIGYSSAGGAVASYLFDQSINTPRDGIVGAVLISGVYGYASQSPTAAQYYGGGPTQTAAHQPRAHVNDSKLPLLLVTAEFDDPPRGADTHELAAAICARDSKCPPFLWLAGHNHLTEFHSIDTPDDRLGARIIAFVRTIAK
jgi:acetyl esterase/lipase